MVTYSHVVIAHDLLHACSGFACIVEGHVGKEVVHHVRVRDVMEAFVLELSIGPVNCAQRTSVSCGLGWVDTYTHE